MNNIYSKFKYFIYLIVILIYFRNNAYALDEKYSWASGYKIKTGDSWDYTNYFKNQVISGGEFDKNQSLLSTWPLTQANWTPDNSQCQTVNYPTLDCGGSVGPHTKHIVYTYTCSGDVSYNLQVKEDANNLVGGDTMYGAWSMLFSYFPPVLDTGDCSQFGRCFVGNAFILDTKAQNEKNPDRLWGLGVKELVEGPGDVFYFDQVRAMTQPPMDTAREYNPPFLVGDQF
jgi:hypothetical protein